MCTFPNHSLCELCQGQCNGEFLWLKIRQAKKAFFKGHSVCTEWIMKFWEQKGRPKNTQVGYLVSSVNSKWMNVVL